ncbi:hypothetical protein BGZ70_009427 [Mortierella alpina]|uniref:Uncharacterized protein n=1 Tax=Mortierella alpina TaxID=64518 RepID=A0A9P6J1T3_MORAP|nr:hypothetical protein BGZ70_009427 [Mortierella alpina]
MPATLTAPPTAYTDKSASTVMVSSKDESLLRHTWHSLEEALHLREPVPPPVPPKDDRWLVKTVNLALPQDQEPDASFWDRIALKITSFHPGSSSESESDENNDEDAVSISVPADAALKQLGVADNDGELQEKRNYFKRMAARCKEKFDEDNETLESSSSLELASIDDEGLQDPEASELRRQHRHSHHLRQYLHALHSHLHRSRTEHGEPQLQSRLEPKVDPKEMRAAHRLLYPHADRESNDAEEEEADRKLFGSWWGCRPRRSKAEALLEQQLDSDWEKIDFPTSKEDKRKSLGEQNGALPVDPTANSTVNSARRSWWKPRQPDTDVVVPVNKDTLKQDRKATTKKLQAIAAAAAYEAMKEHQALKIRQGKKVSHGEMKAVLAGMAMAEAVKLLESRRGSSGAADDDEQRDETVAEAGSKALKLFELLR